MPSPLQWSDDDKATVAQMLAAGNAIWEIAAKVGRTVNAVGKQIQRQGLAVPRVFAQPEEVPPARVFRDLCPGCGTRMDADPALCCARGRALRRAAA